MTPRQAYVAKRLGVLVLIGLALFGWNHGIYWAGGIDQLGNRWGPESMPWQAQLIDFAPVWLFSAGMLGFLYTQMFLSIFEERGLDISDLIWGGYRRLPKGPNGKVRRGVGERSGK